MEFAFSFPYSSNTICRRKNCVFVVNMSLHALQNSRERLQHARHPLCHYHKQYQSTGCCTRDHLFYHSPMYCFPFNQYRSNYMYSCGLINLLFSTLAKWIKHDQRVSLLNKPPPVQQREVEQHLMYGKSNQRCSVPWHCCFFQKYVLEIYINSSLSPLFSPGNTPSVP